MRGLSLFSGIGGLDLAAEMAGIEVACMCEIDSFCIDILMKHWPKVPIFRNVKSINSEELCLYVPWEIDIVYGGFPCQPFSVAGKQKGDGDDRYLWPEFLRVVKEVRPRWVLAENVPGIIKLAADRVVYDLRSEGYSVGIYNYEAASVGAPHRRARVFFVAYSDHGGGPLRRNGQLPKATEAERGWGHYGGRTKEYVTREWWTAEPAVGRLAHGVSRKVARLRALGNAVVPQQAYPLFKAIVEADNSD